MLTDIALYLKAAEAEVPFRGLSLSSTGL